jgi:PAS domain S-box-containing protein
MSNEPVDILLVDDRQEDLVSLRAVLSRPEYTLVTAQSGEQALRHLLEREFAVILLDVHMPTMNGFELARLIKGRERTRHTPIIFLTADDAELNQIYRGYSAGAVDYLSKPADPDIVSAKVAIFADLFRKDRQLLRQAESLHEAERREREIQLAELRLAADKRYRSLAEAIPIMVWTAHPDGTLDYFTRRWSEYTGRGSEESRGDGWLESVHPQDRRRCVKAWTAAVAAGAPFRVECRFLRRADGTYRWHLAQALPERGEDQRIVAWLGTFSDTEELKQAIRARDEFLAVASHELRTPLTALKLRVSSLQRNATVDERLRRGVDAAVRQVERLERLVESLLDVSRITTGHLELERERVDLAELVRDVVERMQGDEQVNGVCVVVDAPARVEGSWDRLRIEQVLVNLLSNALKFGEGKPVDVVLRGDERSATLAVRDRGVGIRAAQQAKIFGQFERVAAKRKEGGLGMGLYISRQIVEAHGGKIGVLSQPGEGSEFSVELPRS